MNERPIIFSKPMVRAILSGQKTQTRRILKPQPDTSTPGYWAWSPRKGVSTGKALAHVWGPHGVVGDRLWVRENYYCDHLFSGKQGTVEEWRSMLYYAADYDTPQDWANAEEWAERTPPWTPSIHMFRWASRILLEITDVRVERLNDISGQDAKSEGVDPYAWSGGDVRASAICAFAELWDIINGKTHSWASNPWVWVICFKVIEVRGAT